MSALEKQVSSAQGKSRDQQADDTGEQTTMTTQAAVNARQLREVKLELEQARQTIAGLEEQLAKSQQHAEQFKVIADTMESNLAASTQVSVCDDISIALRYT